MTHRAVETPSWLGMACSLLSSDAPFTVSSEFSSGVLCLFTSRLVCWFYSRFFWSSFNINVNTFDRKKNFKMRSLDKDLSLTLNNNYYKWAICMCRVQIWLMNMTWKLSQVNIQSAISGEVILKVYSLSSFEMCNTLVTVFAALPNRSQNTTWHTVLIENCYTLTIVTTLFCFLKSRFVILIHLIIHCDLENINMMPCYAFIDRYIMFESC